MVVTDRPETSFTAVMQARAASPSIWTVQAPHSATPQPYFVPVSPNSSRRNQSNGIDGSPSKDCSWPLTRNLTIGVPPRVGADRGFYLRRSGPGNIVNQRTLGHHRLKTEQGKSHDEGCRNRKASW